MSELPSPAPADGAHKAKRKIEGIEVLRFLLAAGVMIYHYGYFGPLTGRIPGVTPGPEWMVSGRFGVSAFFIISGFVIIYSAGARGAYAFALARFGRLAPALLVCATVTTLVLTLWPDSGAGPGILLWARAASTLGLLLGGPYVDGSYWSITIELRFYLWVFLFLLLFKDMRHIRIIAAVWLALSVLVMAVPGLGPLRIAVVSPHSGFFILGILLYCDQILEDRRFFAMLIVPTLALAAWQGFVDFRHVDALAGGHAPWAVGLVIAGASFALVRLAMFGIDDPVWSRRARTLGAMSYPLYLMHQAMGYRIIAGLVAAGVIAPVAIACCALLMIGGAWLLSRYVEPAGRALIVSAGRSIEGRFLSPKAARS